MYKKAFFNTKKPAREMLNILRKPFLTVKDIAELLGCSKTTAWRAYKEIDKDKKFDGCVKRSFS